MNKTIEKVINSVYAGNRELKQSLVENGFENVEVENGIGFSAEKENEKYLFSQLIHQKELVTQKKLFGE